MIRAHDDPRVPALRQQAPAPSSVAVEIVGVILASAARRLASLESRQARDPLRSSQSKAVFDLQVTRD